MLGIEGKEGEGRKEGKREKKRRIMFSSKNLVIFLIASGFALYQFNKARKSASTHTPVGQMKKAHQLLTQHLDMFKYEIFEGTNQREQRVLSVLHRPKAGAKGSGGLAAPRILAEVTVDATFARRRRQNQRRSPRARRAAMKRARQRSRRKAGGAHRNPYARGRSTKLEDIVLEPALLLHVYDNEMSKLQDLLENYGLVEEKTKDVNDRKRSTSEADRERLKQKSIAAARERESQKKEEESQKRNEEGKKKKEEERKRKKRKGTGQAASDDDTVIEVHPDGSRE